MIAIWRQVLQAYRFPKSGNPVFHAYTALALSNTICARLSDSDSGRRPGPLGVSFSHELSLFSVDSGIPNASLRVEKVTTFLINSLSHQQSDAEGWSVSLGSQATGGKRGWRVRARERARTRESAREREEPSCACIFLGNKALSLSLLEPVRPLSLSLSLSHKHFQMTLLTSPDLSISLLPTPTDCVLLQTISSHPPHRPRARCHPHLPQPSSS